MSLWVDGRLVPDGEPVLRADDHGVTVGDGVFETAKVIDGEPFALRRHLERLAHSAAVMRLPLDLDAVRAGIAAVLADAGHPPSGRLRITVTGGPAPPGSARGDTPPTVVVALAPLNTWPPASAVVTVPWPRNERGATAGVKTTSYADNVVALAYAAERGADEAIFADTRGRLSEGTGSNVFCESGGRLVTPPLDAGCLAGVTRALLLEWLSGAGIDVVEQHLPLEALAAAREAFLASTTREVQPIASVDGAALLAAPGPLTRAAAEAFERGCSLSRDP